LLKGDVLDELSCRSAPLRACLAARLDLALPGVGLGRTMTTTAVVHFAGALLGIALISRLPVWLLKAWQERSLFRLLAAHFFTYVLVAVVSAYAETRGVDPPWKA